MSRSDDDREAPLETDGDDSAMTRLWLIGLLLLAANVGACAKLDDFLEISIGSDPSVIFPCDLREVDGETLVLVGVADATVIDGFVYRSLDLLLKNQSDDVDAVSAADGRHSVYLRLQPVSSAELARLVDDPSGWAGMDVFALRLRGLSVDPASLSKLENLDDGETRNINYRGKAMIQGRRIATATSALEADRLVAGEKILPSAYVADLGVESVAGGGFRDVPAVGAGPESDP